MKHIENTNIYIADDGKLIVRKIDEFVMGSDIDLGSADSIENYEDRSFSKDEIKSFYESIGIDYKNMEDVKNEV